MKTKGGTKEKGASSCHHLARSPNSQEVNANERRLHATSNCSGESIERTAQPIGKERKNIND